MIHRLVSLLLLVLITLPALAQESADQIEMADRLRADGKIWVVVLVIAATFAGIVVYLVRLDSKISKLEKEIRK